MAEAAEIVRQGYERLNADDLEGFLELCDPEIELHDVPEIPGSTLYRGREGIRRWWTTVTESMEELRFELGLVAPA